MNQKSLLLLKASKLLEQYGRLHFSCEEIQSQKANVRKNLLQIEEELKLIPDEVKTSEPKENKDEQGSK
jgi:hypothetical protein